MAKPEGDQGLFEIMYSCRAMRRLKPDPVPEETLMQLVDAALQGPSGSNSQNWHFIIVRQRAVKERMAAVLEKSLGLLYRCSRRYSRAGRARISRGVNG